MNTIKRDHLVTLRINKEQWQLFQEWAKDNSLSGSLALCKLVDMCIDGNIDIHSQSLATSQNQSISDDKFQSIENRFSEIEKRLAKIENK